MTDEADTHRFKGEEMDGLSAVERQFIVTTAGAIGHGNVHVSELLEMVLEHFAMDVAFVSEFTEGRRVFRQVVAYGEDTDLLTVDGSDLLEESYCQKVVDGRLPQVMQDAMQHPVASLMPATRAVGVGGHVSVPVVLEGGSIYGTLCCFSHQPKPELKASDAQTLRLVAKLVAAAIERPRTR